MSRGEFKKSNMDDVDSLISSLEKAINYLTQIENSKASYTQSGFIHDDQGCQAAFYSSVSSLKSQLNSCLSVINTNKGIMENNSSWAGE